MQSEQGSGTLSRPERDLDARDVISMTIESLADCQSRSSRFLDKHPPLASNLRRTALQLQG